MTGGVSGQQRARELPGAAGLLPLLPLHPLPLRHRPLTPRLRGREGLANKRIQLRYSTVGYHRYSSVLDKIIISTSTFDDNDLNSKKCA